MPQADSHNITAMSAIGGLSAFAAHEAITPLFNETIATQAQKSLHGPTVAAIATAVVKESTMTRRTALKAVAATAVALDQTTRTAPAFAQRRSRSTLSSLPLKSDPIFPVLEKYRLATIEVIESHGPYAAAEEKLPREFVVGPLVLLERNRGGGPDRFAYNHADIKRFCDKGDVAYRLATVNHTDEARARVMAPAIADRKRLHDELDEKMQQYEKFTRKIGYDVAKKRVLTAFASETAAEEAIAETEPTTLVGASALARFLETVIKEDESTVNQELAGRICANIVSALVKIGAQAAPDVMPYRYFPKPEVG
jgi:hypothetical protein